MSGTALTQLQDVTFCLVEPHKVLVSLLLKVAQSLWMASHLSAMSSALLLPISSSLNSLPFPYKAVS